MAASHYYRSTMRCFIWLPVPGIPVNWKEIYSDSPNVGQSSVTAFTTHWFRWQEGDTHRSYTFTNSCHLKVSFPGAEIMTKDQLSWRFSWSIISFASNCWCAWRWVCAVRLYDVTVPLTKVSLLWACRVSATDIFWIKIEIAMNGSYRLFLHYVY